MGDRQELRQGRRASAPRRDGTLRCPGLRSRRAAGLVALLLLGSACAAPPEAAPAVEPELAAVIEETFPEPATPIADAYRPVAARILAAAAAEGRAYERLRYLCDHIGPRLSGSVGLEKAVAWTARTMEEDGLDTVRQEPVMVPKWVRGDESARMVAPREDALHILGLGNSIGTPEGGITADVLVIGDFDELERRAAEAAGKIVLFDFAMPRYDPERGAGYGQTVAYRVNGASQAAVHGALAVLVRSVTATSLDTPHTGMLRYERTKPKIPAAAVTIEDATMMARLAEAGETVRVHLEMQAHFEDDAPSANVVGELRGSEFPDEVVVMGGHLDSWDVGQGAHDDGGPCMAAMDAVRLLKELGLRPRRTIRVVLFTNEENGLAGGRDFVRRHAKEMKDVVAAIEADSGVFRPTGFRNPKPKEGDGRMARVRAQLEDIVSLLEPIGAARIKDGGGGADIGPMAAFGVPQIGLEVAGRLYFDYHHTHADTFDKVDRDEIHLCEAALAVMAYVIADLPERLGE